MAIRPMVWAAANLISIQGRGSSEVEYQSESRSLSATLAAA